MPEAAVLMIHTDGASHGNPGPAAFAYTIERDGEEPIEEAGKLGRMTNNQAEYLASFAPWNTLWNSAIITASSSTATANCSSSR